MGKRFSNTDLSRMQDDKALAIAAFGESVAAYRYILLSEKARDSKLRNSFEEMSKIERSQRDQLQALLQKIAPAAGFVLTPEDKLAVSVGPRLVDARDDARFDEAMKLVIASEKRSSSFYLRYAAYAKDSDVRILFAQLAADGLKQVQRLRTLFADIGRQISEPCPLSELRMS